MVNVKTIPESLLLVCRATNAQVLIFTKKNSTALELDSIQNDKFARLSIPLPQFRLREIPIYSAELLYLLR